MITQLEMAAIIAVNVENSGSMEWRQIVGLAQTKRPNMPEGMWLRNALQIAINKGAIVRTDSIHKEIYIPVEGEQ